jgi:hypothetical protein
LTEAAGPGRDDGSAVAPVAAGLPIERWNICAQAASIGRGAERYPEQMRLALTFWLMGRGHGVGQPVLPVAP